MLSSLEQKCGEITSLQDIFDINTQLLELLLSFYTNHWVERRNGKIVNKQQRLTEEILNSVDRIVHVMYNVSISRDEDDEDVLSSTEREVLWSAIGSTILTARNLFGPFAEKALRKYIVGSLISIDVVDEIKAQYNPLFKQISETQSKCSEVTESIMPEQSSFVNNEEEEEIDQLLAILERDIEEEKAKRRMEEEKNERTSSQEVTEKEEEEGEKEKKL